MWKFAHLLVNCALSAGNVESLHINEYHGNSLLETNSPLLLMFSSSSMRVFKFNGKSIYGKINFTTHFYLGNSVRLNARSFAHSDAPDANKGNESAIKPYITIKHVQHIRNELFMVYCVCVAWVLFRGLFLWLSYLARRMFAVNMRYNSAVLKYVFNTFGLRTILFECLWVVANVFVVDLSSAGGSFASHRLLIYTSNLESSGTNTSATAMKCAELRLVHTVELK